VRTFSFDTVWSYIPRVQEIHQRSSTSFELSCNRQTDKHTKAKT